MATSRSSTHDSTRALDEHQLAWQLGAAAVGLLLVILGLVWLRHQLPTRRHLHDTTLDVHDDTPGTTIVDGRAFANAFEADVRRHPDVLDARADMLLTTASYGSVSPPPTTSTSNVSSPTLCDPPSPASPPSPTWPPHRNPRSTSASTNTTAAPCNRRNSAPARGSGPARVTSPATRSRVDSPARSGRGGLRGSRLLPIGYAGVCQHAFLTMHHVRTTTRA